MLPYHVLPPPVSEAGWLFVIAPFAWPSEAHLGRLIRSRCSIGQEDDSSPFFRSSISHWADEIVFDHRVRCALRARAPASATTDRGSGSPGSRSPVPFFRSAT